MRARLLALTLLLPAHALAQDAREALCPAFLEQRAYCNSIKDALFTTQAHAGLASVGGNPTPGSSSTLGMRLGSLPRISAAVRFTGVKSEIPPIERSTSTGEVGHNQSVIALDAAVGLHSGFSLLPTVGGVGSLDVIGSIGSSFSADGEGFEGDAAPIWNFGLRLGILQESFTAPGISVTAKLGRIPEIVYGDSALNGTHAYFRLEDNRVLSTRAMIGKRLFVLGATVGVGYDRFTSNVSMGQRNCPGNTLECRGELFVRDIENSRTMVFGNLQYTLLVLSLIAEGGWQKGDSESISPLRPGVSSISDQNAAFLSFVLRLTI
jgi:hypothetical protein